MGLSDNPTRYEPGRWHLVCYDNNGFVFDEQLADWCDWLDSGTSEPYGESDGEPRTIMIFKDSARPRSQSKRVDDFHRSPVMYSSLDVAAEWEVDGYGGAEIMTIWRRGHRMVQGLNG